MSLWCLRQQERGCPAILLSPDGQTLVEDGMVGSKSLGQEAPPTHFSRLEQPMFGHGEALKHV
jgi:hypothetical protein